MIEHIKKLFYKKNKCLDAPNWKVFESEVNPNKAYIEVDEKLRLIFVDGKFDGYYNPLEGKDD